MVKTAEQQHCSGGQQQEMVVCGVVVVLQLLYTTTYTLSAKQPRKVQFPFDITLFSSLVVNAMNDSGRTTAKDKQIQLVVV